MTVPWSDLPGDLLERIANILLAVDIRNPIDYLRNPIDYIRFRAVCAPWRSSTLDPHNLKPPLPDKLPWALHLRDDSLRSDIATFLRLSDSKTFQMSLPEELCCGATNIVGSADGWLAVLTLTAAPAAIRLVLVNPLTRAQIHLPPLASVVKSSEDGSVVTIDCFGHISNRGVEWMLDMLFFHGKVAFSEDHTVVMVYIWYYHVLAFVSRPGGGDEQQWTVINLLPGWNLSDILHHKGSFYASDHRGRLAICNLAPPASLTPVASTQEVVTKFQFWFLASSGEELLLIAQSHRSFPLRVSEVRVFRLEYPSSSSSSTETTILHEVESLGDRILFLGRYSRSLCLSASDCPPGYNKPNTICFTITGGRSSYGAKYYEFGFYNLEDGCFYPTKPSGQQQKGPPMWFTPSLR